MFHNFFSNVVAQILQMATSIRSWKLKKFGEESGYTSVKFPHGR